MSKPLVTILGKAVKNVAKLRGGGSALPGLVVERIYPDFIKHTLAGLPLGSSLPKNPAIADFLIQQAVTRKYGKFTKSKISDHYTDLARKFALKRPR